MDPSTSPPQDTEDVRRASRIMTPVRWVAVVYALWSVLTYDAAPYPAGVEATALGLAGVLGVGNLVAMWAKPRAIAAGRGRAFSVSMFVFDVIVVGTFVGLYAFDQANPVWFILVLLPVEGAIRFQLTGAVTGWLAAAAAYILREVFGQVVFDTDLSVPSIVFRMALIAFVAAAVGLNARDLVGERRRTQEALDEVRAVERWRRRLVDTLAHDVRGPLAAMELAAQTLLDRADALNPDGVRQIAGVIVHRAQALRRLAADLLDLSRSERGRLELKSEEVALRDLVDDVISFQDPVADVQLEIDAGLRIHGDPARIEQIVANLVSNAVRHGRPPVTVDATEVAGGVEITVSDRGSGVPDAVREHLFEPFSAHGDQEQSIGLGLWIVRLLTEAHGGSVTYEDVAGGGARFRVHLPSRPTDPDHDRAEERSAAR